MKLQLPAISRELRPDLAELIEAMPASQLIGLQVAGFAPGGVSVVTLAINPQLSFDGATVQGGIVGMLADYAGVSAVASLQPEGWACMTLGFQVNNLGAARRSETHTCLAAVGTTRQSGKTHGVATVDVWLCDAGLSDGVLVATATTQCKPFCFAPS
jgi:acyl-coenzyme A thioesterase PaaI-like protein